MSDAPPPPPPSFSPPPPPPGGGGGAAPGSSAEIGPRIIAFAIDLIAIPIALSIIGQIMSRIVGILGLLFLLVQLAYVYVYVPYTEGTTGQTIGKKMQKIKTVSAETGQPLGFPMAFARYFINYIVCGLGWLLPFVDSQKQTLGDKVAKGITVPA